MSGPRRLQENETVMHIDYKISLQYFPCVILIDLKPIKKLNEKWNNLQTLQYHHDLEEKLVLSLTQNCLC